MEISVARCLKVYDVMNGSKVVYVYERILLEMKIFGDISHTWMYTSYGSNR